jgi:hypothetical protein
MQAGGGFDQSNEMWCSRGRADSDDSVSDMYRSSRRHQFSFLCGNYAMFYCVAKIKLITSLHETEQGKFEVSSHPFLENSLQ